MRVRVLRARVRGRVRSSLPSPLLALTGTVIAAGLVAVLLQPLLLESSLQGAPGWLVPVHVLMVAVAGASLLRVRVRSANAGVSWTDSAILICILSLPSGWVGPSVLAGAFLGKLVGRVRPYKALYNASRDALSAMAGLLVAQQVGVSQAADPSRALLGVIAVALTITVVELVVGMPVIALVARTPWHRVLRDGLDIGAAFFAGKLVVVMLALLVFADHRRLLVLMPPAALCLHLLVASRMRARSDRVAWQRLATTTERLDATDLDSVLRAAVGDAVSLFSAERAEVLVRQGPHGPWLAWGDAQGQVWSGDPSLAPPLPGGAVVVTAPMAGDDGPMGEVRLHLGAGVGLSDRELLTLRTFASAVRTAARKASALAVADEMARSSADAQRHDPLTGLANRTSLQEHGERLLAAPGLVVLVMLDIDGVRDVNESLGHRAGDQVLVEVSRRLSTVAGAGDVVARLPGAAFAVLLGDVASSRVARERAAALLESLSPPVDVGGVRVRVEATAGLAERPAGEAPPAVASVPAPQAIPAVASVPAPQPTPAVAWLPAPQASPAVGGGAPEAFRDLGTAVGVADPLTAAATAVAMAELLRRADVAMRQTKRGGPRVARYEPTRDPADLDALILGGELPRAIAEREFTVCFQPIVDLASGMMVAAEALARWRHPVRGELDPRRFLDAVERSGLLPSFEEAVLDQALAAHARWQAAGVDAPVAVNAGPRSLLDPDYPRLVRGMLARHGVAGADLTVELTESLTLDDLELADATLAQLREAGVRLALDDFGTRSSSMAMVTRVPGCHLKIDRSFVEAMGSSAETLAVVRHTVELGRSLGRIVVAEGVEREDQRQALVEMGCPAGQGHLFARPLPIDELMRVISVGMDGVAGRFARPLN